ncbi:MAG: tRNA(Ile)(2)-agmatinylcytidine synthase [ANME-2 cluster archaeon]|nr:tRNA(Ile)(2)-agmatinylcytidine synthase [ANME-2 cluster archaeon]
MIIGIDDTDSADGMCTTYLTAVLIDQLKELGTIKGLPHLIRLNPNIKYKTRGNAALSLEIDADQGSEQQIMDTTISLVQDMADMECENTNPGIVFVQDRNTQDEEFEKAMESFMWRAIQDVLTAEDACTLIDRFGLAHRGFKNGRGLIGALAACGAIACGLPDHTYEMVAYRLPENFGTLRNIDRDSVFRADEITYPGTWDTVDRANDSVVFAPHSPDPVLFGIRGDDIRAIQQAFDQIESETSGLMILYMTNQGTDMHLLYEHNRDISEDRSYCISGSVQDSPRTIEGGHTFFTIVGDECGGDVESDVDGGSDYEVEVGKVGKDGKGICTIECAAFEPTKGFREVVRKLVTGDRVRVYGSVQNDTLNLEKIEIIELSTHEIAENPICMSCGKHMKSAGRNQGYRCKRCGTKESIMDRTSVNRSIKPGIYEVPPSARRHISMPLVRSADPRAFPSR